jgi:OOP family OmpA-OmpF porin
MTCALVLSALSVGAMADIEPNRISTEGRGETQPLTKAGECLGAKSTKVIACLQPDRRVNIEVVGARIAKL